MKLSVIVPVYNVERFLPRCLDSLLRQGLEAGEYEVICVNDGSTDKSFTILVEYEKKYPEIFKVITQENKGVGPARNVGLKVAQGEWIGFADPDDYLMDGGYKYLLDSYCQENVDVVAFEKYYVYTDGIERKFATVPLEGMIVFEGDGAVAHDHYELPSVCSKLFRRKFLQQRNLFFEAVYYEDLLFIFKMFSYHPHFIYTNCKVYGYEKNQPSSQMHQIDKKVVLSQMYGLLRVVDFMNRYLCDKNCVLDEAARRCIGICMDEFYRKALRVFLTRKEWELLMRRVGKIPLHKATETGRCPKKYAIIKNLSSYSYVNYLVIRFFYCKFVCKLV